MFESEIPTRRVIIQAVVNSIPGNPQQRHNTLGDAFCGQILGREFCAKLRPSGYDHVHIPGDFDSTEPLKRWFIFDLGVTGELNTEMMSQIPVDIYLASYQHEKW
jgi:methylsterol monooxygenase